MRGGNTSLLIAGGAVALALYNRGVWASAWHSLFGADVPLLLGNPVANLPVDDNGVVAPGSGSVGAWDEWTQSGCNVGNYSCLHAWQASHATGTGGVTADALARAESAATAGGAPGGGNDFLNWCLYWVRKVRTNLTGTDPGGVFGAATAAAACSASHLTLGSAPLGANVCFRDNATGHIGISNGNGTYTSVGISHGGPTTLPYLSNPAYIGWF